MRSLDSGQGAKQGAGQHPALYAALQRPGVYHSPCPLTGGLLKEGFPALWRSRRGLGRAFVFTSLSPTGNITHTHSKLIMCSEFNGAVTRTNLHPSRTARPHFPPRPGLWGPLPLFAPGLQTQARGPDALLPLLPPSPSFKARGCGLPVDPDKEVEMGGLFSTANLVT